MSSINTDIDKLYKAMMPEDSVYAEISIFVHEKGEAPKVEIEYQPDDDSYTFRLRRRGFAVLVITMNASQFSVFHDNYQVQSLQAFVERDTLQEKETTSEYRG